jgi:mannosyl-3-phosphoglycerate phosphatase
MAAVQPIIFTDMDGSLLDHDTYSHAVADELLAWLRNKQILVIPAKERIQLMVLIKQCVEIINCS